MSVKLKISALLQQLNKGIYEKEDVIKLTLLSAVAGESIFLLGAPGVAKSLIARRLKFAFKENGAFEYLMNRFSTPDEIFGPVSISKLKNEDKYERVVKNYLPSASVVFLDEIWKAGPSIQNALLTVLNERKYRNGEQEIDVPMKALISASNELPMKDSGLDALWDRFLIRMEVKGIEDKDKFNEMITKPFNPYENTGNDELKISDEEYKRWSKEIDKIEIPENVLNVIHVIRAMIQQHNEKEENKDNPVYISDRRWKKIGRLLRTSAFLNDRKAVDLMDCFLIIPCIWNETSQIKAVEQFVKEAVKKHGYSIGVDLSTIKEQIKDFETEIKEETKKIKDTRVVQLVRTNEDYFKILNFDSNNDLISINDYKALKNTDTIIDLYYLDINRYGYHYNQLRRNGKFPIRKGKNKYHIIINNKEYKLETIVNGEKTIKTTKPHKVLEKHWDSISSKIIKGVSELIEQLEHYQNSDLKEIRTNLFVHPGLAGIVESNIAATKKAIEKLKVDVREVQNSYKELEEIEEPNNDNSDLGI